MLHVRVSGLILLVAVTAALAAQPTTAPTSQPVFQHYSSDKLKCTFDYPAAWAIRAGEQQPGVVTIDAPETFPGETQPNFVACTYKLADLDGVKTLEDFARHEEQIIAGLPNVRILKTTPTTLAGMAATSHYFRWHEDGKDPTEVLSIATVKDEMVYGVSVTASAGQFKRYAKEIQTMLGSFKVAP